MINRWSLYEDSETWRYSFEYKSVKSYLELLKKFITICEESKISKLSLRNSEKGEVGFSEKLHLFISFLERLKNTNNRGVYPRVSSFGVYNFGKDTFFDFIFSNELYVYDQYGEVVNLSITQDSLLDQLSKIRHGQMGQRGLTLPFEFETYYGIAPTGEVKSYDFLININSDIWLKKVPCPHCERIYNIDELRDQGGLSSVKNYWYDNTELCKLNGENMNSFLAAMNGLCSEMGGEMHIEELRLYQDKIGNDELKI